MAAGDRKVKVQEIRIVRGNPVTYQADWQLFVENRVGEDVYVRSGSHSGSFGTPAAFRAMTGLQMENQVSANVAASPVTPANDSLT